MTHHFCTLSSHSSHIIPFIPFIYLYSFFKRFKKLKNIQLFIQKNIFFHINNNFTHFCNTTKIVLLFKQYYQNKNKINLHLIKLLLKYNQTIINLSCVETKHFIKTNYCTCLFCTHTRVML